MNYLKHLFSSDFIIVAGVFGILFYFLYDAIRRKKWGWAIFIAILPLWLYERSVIYFIWV
jgi:hypothetical protein